MKNVLLIVAMGLAVAGCDLMTQPTEGAVQATDAVVAPADATSETHVNERDQDQDQSHDQASR
ncbi:MAG: hypothetical protein PHX82_04070 [Paracoccaceae bacterium]|nr:hypothetical protein [Paracoccaceae bacterium]